MNSTPPEEFEPEAAISPQSLRVAEFLWIPSVLIYLLLPNYEPLNALIADTFKLVGADTAICSAYLDAMRIIGAAPAGECSSRLFGSLAFGFIMLATFLSVQFLLVRYGIRYRIDVLVSLIFILVGVLIASIVRSTNEVHIREWTAIGCLAITLAGLATLCVGVHTLLFKKWRG